MNKSVIIFDGEEDHEISLKYFFQDPKIEKLKPDQVVEMYQSTAVFTSIIREMDNLISSGIVKNINESKTDAQYAKKVEDGLYILEGMIMDLFGKSAGLRIINGTNKEIDEYTP